MNEAEKVLQALDVAYRTKKNLIRIPASLVTENLRKVLNISAGQYANGRVAQFKVEIVPDVQLGFDEHFQP